MYTISGVAIAQAGPQLWLRQMRSCLARAAFRVGTAVCENVLDLGTPFSSPPWSRHCICHQNWWLRSAVQCLHVKEYVDNCHRVAPAGPAQSRIKQLQAQLAMQKGGPAGRPVPAGPATDTAVPQPFKAACTPGATAGGEPVKARNTPRVGSGRPSAQSAAASGRQGPAAAKARLQSAQQAAAGAGDGAAGAAGRLLSPASGKASLKQQPQQPGGEAALAAAQQAGRRATLELLFSQDHAASAAAAGPAELGSSRGTLDLPFSQAEGFAEAAPSAVAAEVGTQRGTQDLVFSQAEGLGQAAPSAVAAEAGSRRGTLDLLFSQAETGAPVEATAEGTPRATLDLLFSQDGQQPGRDAAAMDCGDSQQPAGEKAAAAAAAGGSSKRGTLDLLFSPSDPPPALLQQAGPELAAAAAAGEDSSAPAAGGESGSRRGTLDLMFSGEGLGSLTDAEFRHFQDTMELQQAEAAAAGSSAHLLGGSLAGRHLLPSRLASGAVFQESGGVRDGQEAARWAITWLLLPHCDCPVPETA